MLHYQKRQILQHTMVNQLGALRTQNSQIQSQITRLKQHPEYATSAIRMQLNRIRPNETFYVTD